MLILYRSLGTHLVRCEAEDPIPPDTVWIDCFRPTREEDAAVERYIGVSLPTREEMEEIEPSSRLADEDGALYLTAAVLCRSESDEPGTTAVTFVLTERHLATVRYDETGMMPIAVARATRPGCGVVGPAATLSALLEAVIDRLADVTEATGARIETIANHIFAVGVGAKRKARLDHTLTLRKVGREGMRLGHMGESLISLSRLLLYVSGKAAPPMFSREDKAQMKTMQRDVEALRDHVHTLEDRVTFLLDATLGLITIQQNEIIKFVSVLGVIFLPPTLVASIYGMNFKDMPELSWTWGYPAALAAMVVIVLATFAVFRWRNLL
jgi:magnesium transporter